MASWTAAMVGTRCDSSDNPCGARVAASPDTALSLVAKPRAAAGRDSTRLDARATTSTRAFHSGTLENRPVRAAACDARRVRRDARAPRTGGEREPLRERRRRPERRRAVEIARLVPTVADLRETTANEPPPRNYVRSCVRSLKERRLEERRGEETERKWRGEGRRLLKRSPPP